MVVVVVGVILLPFTPNLAHFDLIFFYFFHNLLSEEILKKLRKKFWGNFLYALLPLGTKKRIKKWRFPNGSAYGSGEIGRAHV